PVCNDNLFAIGHSANLLIFQYQKRIYISSPISSPSYKDKICWSLLLSHSNTLNPSSVILYTFLFPVSPLIGAIQPSLLRLYCSPYNVPVSKLPCPSLIYLI